MSALSTRTRSVSRPMQPPVALRSRRPIENLRSFLMLLGLEIRRSQGYWLLPVMIGIGVYAPSIDHLPVIVLWPEMSMATLESYVIVGPLGGALAAWLMDRDRRRRLGNLVVSTPGGGFQRDLLALGSAAFWGLAGYAGVAAWFCGQAALRATWGGPDVGLVATGAVAVVAFAAVGVLVGRLLPGKFSPLVALAVTFFLTIGAESFKITSDDGSYRNPFQLLMPLGLSNIGHPNVFYRENEGFVLNVGFWMLALVGLLIAVIALLRVRNARTWIALASTLVMAGFAATPLIDPILSRDPRSWTPIEYTLVCREEGGFEICLHPAYEMELAGTADQIASTFGPILGLDGVPSRWEQGNPFQDRSDAEVGALYDVGYDYVIFGMVTGIFPVGVDGDPFGSRPASQLVVMDWLVEQADDDRAGGGYFGWPAEVPVTTQKIQGGEQISPDEAALTAWQLRMDAARERFAALPDGEQRAWLEANWTALRAGELTLEEWP